MLLKDILILVLNNKDYGGENMAIQYIEGLSEEGSNKKYALIDLEDLCLDKKNPRFSSSTIIGNKREIKETEIIEYLLQFGNVAQLAESINENNGLYDEEWISCYKNAENEIVVLEGNRRIAACKILKNPELVPERITYEMHIPSANEKTLQKICRIKCIVYTREIDAQGYIAAKHTKPEVKRWETVEQCNYFYEQFISGLTTLQISMRVGEDDKKICEKIKWFGLFIKVFDVVKEKYPNVLIEDINILPLVTRFMPPLISKSGRVALGLMFDRETLTYSADPVSKDIFDEIILMIGEAFFVRPKMKGANSLGRELDDKYRISSDEIKTKGKVEQLIIDDVRIPGLYDLILKYKKQQKCNVKDDYNNQSNKEENKEGATSTNNSNNDSRANGAKKTLEFFADLDYSRVNRSTQAGLFLVCEEIKKISSYNAYSAYKQFPIASSFLLRSLIEQILSERLKQVGDYNNMIKTKPGKSTKTPELGAMIQKFLSDYTNGNLNLFWGDGDLGKQFNQCFSGFGTKDQLDTIIHNPHMIQPDQSFLNSLANQGLKLVMQGFLDRI